MLYKFEVLIGGTPHGSGNIGDEAIANVIVNRLKQTIKPDRIGLMTRDFTRATNVFGVKPISFWQKHYLRTFLSSKRFIFAGATMLSQAPNYSCALLERAHLLRRPILIYAAGMNSIDDAKSRCRVARACNNAQLITVRDYESGIRLREIGVNIPDIVLAGDTVLGIEPASEETGDNILSRNHIDITSPTAVVGMCFEPGYENHLPEESEIAVGLDYLASHGFQILFVSMETRFGCDHSAHMRVFHLMKHRSSVAFIHEFLQAEELASILLNAKLVISSRLHLLILGAIAGLPSISIARQEKIANFSKSVGQVSVSTSQDFTGQKLISAANEIFSNEATVRRDLNKKVRSWKRNEQLNRLALELFLTNQLTSTNKAVWGTSLIPN